MPYVVTEREIASRVAVLYFSGRDRITQYAVETEREVPMGSEFEEVGWNFIWRAGGGPKVSAHTPEGRRTMIEAFNAAKAE